MMENIKKSALVEWESISTEIRPSSLKNEDGSLKPFYLKRSFSLLPEDHFTLEIINYADPYGQIPLVKIMLKGHVEWQGSHPIIEGAQKVDFTADKTYEVTPLVQDFTVILNSLAKENFEIWETGKSQSILKKKFLPFGLSEGQVFKEYDLMYIFNDLMFWGARNIDGRGFDTEANRPTNLQIPMRRK